MLFGLAVVLFGLATVVKNFDSLIALFIFLSNSLMADAGLLAGSKSFIESCHEILPFANATTKV